MGRLPQITSLNSIWGNVDNSPTTKYCKGTLPYILPVCHQYHGRTHKIPLSCEGGSNRAWGFLWLQGVKCPTVYGLQKVVYVSSLTGKIQRLAHAMKNQLILHLVTTTEAHIGCEDEQESEHWTNSIDRGGLKHVNNTLIMLLTQMKLILCQHLNSRQANEHSDVWQAITKIMNDGNVYTILLDYAFCGVGIKGSTIAVTVDWWTLDNTVRILICQCTYGNRYISVYLFIQDIIHKEIFKNIAKSSTLTIVVQWNLCQRSPELGGRLAWQSVGEVPNEFVFICV